MVSSRPGHDTKLGMTLKLCPGHDTKLLGVDGTPSALVGIYLGEGSL